MRYREVDILDVIHLSDVETYNSRMVSEEEYCCVVLVDAFLYLNSMLLHFLLVRFLVGFHINIIFSYVLDHHRLLSIVKIIILINSE